MEEKLIDIIVSVCEEEEIREDLDLDLVEEGLLDSLAMVELIVAIEEEFGVTISMTEYTKEDLSTVNKIKNVLINKGL